MTAVFDRYPSGGGEMLLALSLADFADDDGTRVFPSIKQLAEKTRQSERTVQYQLRRMEDMGWLILINSGNGGRNQRREYVINPEWIKGADIAPIAKGATDDVKGADSGTKGCNPRQERVQPVAPAYNHHRSTIDTPKNHQRANDLQKPKPSTAKPKKPASRFDEFWETYPNTARRVAKTKCLQRWKTLKLDLFADDIIEHLKAMKATKQWKDGYEPAPLTYLNQNRWEDGIPTEKTGATRHGNFGQQDYYAGVGANGEF